MFSSFPEFSHIFHHFDIKNLHDEKYLYLFLESGVGVLGSEVSGSGVLGSWGPANRICLKRINWITALRCMQSWTDLVVF